LAFDVQRLFFLLSGEHQRLPAAEIKAILDSEKIPFKNVKTFKQILSLDAEENAVLKVHARASYTKSCCIELFNEIVDEEDILRRVSEIEYETFVKRNQTIAVRVTRVQRSSPTLRVENLEREIGRVIIEKTMGVGVNLESPDITFQGVITSNHFIFGIKIGEVDPKSFDERRPRKRPFFHPSGLQPKLARCMVNLSRARSGAHLLDPFCGTGSILVEGGTVGCRVVGSDVQSSMVEGSLKNLRRFSIEPLGLVVSDALQLPFKMVDCVATDPPYGRLATTLGSPVKKLIQDFLSSVIDVIPKNGHVVISSPKGLKMRDLGAEVGFEATERYFIYVHRSLTRELAVLKKGRRRKNCA
jgi:tRNA (guanine10-N2)-dimethyltransferase